MFLLSCTALTFVSMSEKKQKIFFQYYNSGLSATTTRMIKVCKSKGNTEIDSAYSKSAFLVTM